MIRPRQPLPGRSVALVRILEDRLLVAAEICINKNGNGRGAAVLGAKLGELVNLELLRANLDVRAVVQ